MKFCKAQEAFLAETMPEWAPYCVDYKNAKKMLNALIPVKERRPLRAVSAAEMSACREEVAFFRLLRIEVDKVNTFSMSMRQQMELRSKSLNDGIRLTSRLIKHEQLMKSVPCLRSQLWTRQMRACINVYNDLLMFEQWLILSFTAFAKLLKKHDKRQGVSTKDSFISKVVLAGDDAPFKHYRDLLVMLNKVENSHQNIARELENREEFEEALRSKRESLVDAMAPHCKYAESLFSACVAVGQSKPATTHFCATSASPDAAVATAASDAAVATAALEQPPSSQLLGGGDGQESTSPSSKRPQKKVACKPAEGDVGSKSPKSPSNLGHAEGAKKRSARGKRPRKLATSPEKRNKR